MKSLKILFIGNSFSQNTSHYLAPFALDRGVETVKVGTLYIGGCSVNMHTAHFESAAPVYEYYVDEGEGAVLTPNVSINQAVDSDVWDIIAIQSGTGDGSLVTAPASYDKVERLASLVRASAKGNPRILFCMTWIGEACHSHAEIRSFDGDTALMYRLMRDIVRDTVAHLPGIDGIVPGGTAVENARTCLPSEKLSLDHYHMSGPAGLALLALNFLATAVDLDVTGLTLCPEGLTKEDMTAILRCVEAAKASPFAITQIR